MDFQTLPARSVKNLKLILILTGAFLVLWCPSASAQSSLTLDRAVNEALRGSPNLQRVESVAEEARWKKTESLAFFLPSLNLTATYLTNKKYMLTDISLGGANVSVPAVLPTTNFVFQAQLPLFDGLANVDRYRSAIALESAASSEASWARFRTQREVILQFYKAIAARALKEVAEQNLRTLQDHLHDVNLFKRAGISTNYDVLRVDVQLSEARSEVMNTEDNLYLARSRLNEFLGMGADDRPLDGALPLLSSSILQNVKPEVDSRRGDLAALAEKSRAATLQSQAASKFWVPKISLFGQYQYYNNLDNSYSNTDKFRNAYAGGLMLSWNLFDGLGSVARSGEATEQKIQSEKALLMGNLHAKQELEFWKRKFIYFCSVYSSRQSDIQKSNESVRLARAGRRAGSRTSSDLLDTETELFRARAGAVNSQLGAIDALINLELTMGRKLYDFK